jgi:hypothetical protein
MPVDLDQDDRLVSAHPSYRIESVSFQVFGPFEAGKPTAVGKQCQKAFWKEREEDCPQLLTPGEKNMTNVYIEPRPKGRPEGSQIDDYVVEDHADHALGTFKTQREAIDWAKNNGQVPHVARVRHLNDKRKPDHWRAT